jgi:hypothetical protein
MYWRLVGSCWRSSWSRSSPTSPSWKRRCARPTRRSASCADRSGARASASIRELLVGCWSCGRPRRHGAGSAPGRRFSMPRFRVEGRRFATGCERQPETWQGSSLSQIPTPVVIHASVAAPNGSGGESQSRAEQQAIGRQSRQGSVVGGCSMYHHMGWYMSLRRAEAARGRGAAAPRLCYWSAFASAASMAAARSPAATPRGSLPFGQ